MGKLEGKTALVTGGGRGIGRSVALQLAAEGARVVLNDLDAAPAEEVVEEIRKNGGDAVAVPGSVTAPDFAPRFVQAATDNFGGIDIIINNAGYTWDSVIQKMTDEQWHAILDLHLKAPFDILRAAQPVISAAVKKEKAEGRAVHRKVVNISSVAGVFGNAGQANYSAAKSGVIGLTKTLAKEWGRYNVNVNCVAFGFITTRLTEVDADAGSTIEVEGREIKVGVNPQILEAMKSAIPLGRPGTPEEAAGSVVMLTYPEADYVSGQLLVTGGGFEG
ncbi:3-oxoacyl-[acyl-carrier protein] reductase [Nocardioides daedukensis]|uniref:3-oxoacyl-[acyl-carrier protein] reductase n=1 Tax=Nocardioides daedukensis TaxID=634462 RepID=A0A7Y9S4A6_9ACTN|nr:3-oxoacyl-ACP reductase family protein [Nocardioides daedukensis]NYG59763.1 3-oxoacyl-[acyl-carrier protein] reductase [Nocardioides daedukensis]